MNEAEQRGARRIKWNVNESVSRSSIDRWLHRLALLALATALLPVCTGAFVTTIEAGMAFLDWPSSDGVNMFAYPWLKSTGDKFAEHGHRLAGAAVGLMVLITAVVSRWSTDRSVCRACAITLAMVVVQGMLGGMRVRFNRDSLALVHGFFGGCTVAVLACVAVQSSAAWRGIESSRDAVRTTRPLLSAAAAVVVISGQFLLGGLLRHLHQAFAWQWHPWFALGVAAAVVWALVEARRSQNRWLIGGATWLLGLTCVQAGVGLATWYTRFGWPEYGLVAVQGASSQVIARSLHTIVGIGLMSTAAVHCVCAWRFAPASREWVEATAYPAHEADFAGARP